MSKQSLPSLLRRSSPFLRSFQDEIAHMLDLTRRAAPASGDTSGFFENGVLRLTVSAPQGAQSGVQKIQIGKS